MAGYTRFDVTDQIANGNTVDAIPLDGEFDAIQSAFAAVGGHRHNGTLGEGAPITVIGPAQDVVASGNSLTPKTDNTLDLGSSTLEWKDLWIDGTANIDSLVADTADINGGTIDATVIGATTPAAITGTTVTATDLVATTATVGGAAVTTNSATQTLTNKTINLSNNTLVATSAQLAAAVTDETGSGALVFAASPALTGTPTAPTAPAGTNTTQLATTAHVFAERSNTATLTNKTLTSPTVNAPVISGGTITTSAISGGTISGSTITGGTVSGITDLAIADGGTGASTAADALLNFGLTATAAELNTLDGITASTVELNYVDGVTSPIQTQLDGKQSIDPTLTAFANFNTNGLITQTATDTFTGRTLTAGSGVTITNGDGVAGNPTISISLASQAEAQAGTDDTKVITPLRVRDALNASGSAPIYACRAWVNFDGSVAVPTIRASGNVSSITDYGTGYYGVNFATAMPDTNYAVVASGYSSSRITVEVSTNVYTASSSLIRFDSGAGSGVDVSTASVVVFR